MMLSLGNCGAQTRGAVQLTITDATGGLVGSYRGSHALVIGVSRYRAGWPSLDSVGPETRKIKAALEGNGFQVWLVSDPDAEALQDAFDKFIGDFGYEPENRLLFFFSGHGYSTGDKGFLVPVDAPDPRIDARGFRRRALPMSLILAWCRDMECKHALFLFDSCFSGSIFQTKALPKTPVHINRLTARPVRQFISAGSAGEEVPAKSIFTPMFIRALRGDADLTKDGFITGTELGLYLREKVIYYNPGQTPQYGKIRDPELDEGDFVFALPRVNPALVSAGKSMVIPNLNLELIAIHPGEFLMGSPASEADRNDNETQHRVRITKPFWLGKYELTQRQWQQVMGSNPSHFTASGQEAPVEQVSWEEAMEFCRKMTEMERRAGRLPSGYEYTLPTEAQWEYACRAGTATATAFGNSLSSTQANFDGDYPYGGASEGVNLGKTVKVGSYRPNAWGLYDMHGNVWEWCWDWLGDYPSGAVTDPTGPSTGSIRVGRGGGWNCVGQYCRSADRFWFAPGFRDVSLGFRLCLSSKPKRVE